MSKFDYYEFYDEYNDTFLLAVSKQRFSREQADAIYMREREKDFVDVLVNDGWVRYGFGTIDDKRINGWWLEQEAGARKCPVWVYGRL